MERQQARTRWRPRETRKIAKEGKTQGTCMGRQSMPLIYFSPSVMTHRLTLTQRGFPRRVRIDVATTKSPNNPLEVTAPSATHEMTKPRRITSQHRKRAICNPDPTVPPIETRDGGLLSLPPAFHFASMRWRSFQPTLTVETQDGGFLSPW
jgi:hypothetical protein